MRRERITHYRIERLLGAGGMGEVWAAFDEKLERRVAIKLLPEERASDDARARMLREARAAGALHHPGIVPVFDTGEIDGLTYIVMEWLEGETLAELLARRGRLPVAEAIELVAQAADALGAAHAAGIVHRDVKAANLMIDARGQVRVLDFGLSKRLDSSVAPTVPIDAIDPDAPTALADRGVMATDATLPATPTPGSHSSRDPVTAFGSRMGTPGYAAPELIAGGTADARSDVFSLAVVLYELITGARPFVAETWSELDRQMRAGPKPASVASEGAVGPAFDAVMARAFAPMRADRFATVGELVDAARTALTPARGSRRGGAWIFAGAAVVAIAGGAAVVLASGGGDGAPAPRPAPRPAPIAAIAATPRALTSLGGCAEGPIFVDDHTIVFDLSRDGAVDLWAIDRGGGAPRRLVATPAWEWRAAPGRAPGEILFLHTDMTDDAKAAVIALDVATGAERARIPVFASGAAAQGDAILYVVRDGTDVRRRKGDRDESFLTLPPELVAQQLVPSPKGDRFAFTSVPAGSPLRLCTVVPGSAPTCLPGQPTAGRPAFSVDGAGLYYGAPDGLHRYELADARDALILAGARALSGLDVARDGKSLVYSECDERARLVDVAHPDVALVDEEHPSSPAIGPHGELAWVHGTVSGSSLVLRRADGSVIELVPTSFGSISDPAFDRDGTRLAFLAGGAHPGIHVVTTRGAEGGSPTITQLTDGAADHHPYFARDGRVVFTRFDDRNVPHVYTVGGEGGAPVQTAPTSRQVQATNPATGEMLATAGANLVWWDPVRGTSSAPLTGAINPRNISVSPNGRWMVIQAGAAGLTFWRAPLGAPERAEKVAELPADETVDAAAIDDDGRIVAAVSVWRGELRIVDGSF